MNTSFLMPYDPVYAVLKPTASFRFIFVIDSSPLEPQGYWGMIRANESTTMKFELHLALLGS
jgi:hypothetical protein